LFVELALAASEKTRWLKTHFSLFFLGRRPMHSKAARTAAASTPLVPRSRLFF
jgi:hypothetical protein